MKKILFAGHDFKFLTPLLQHFEGLRGWQVLQHRYSGHVPPATGTETQLLADADVIFCEWCLGNAEWYSRHKQPNQRLVIRLHAQELRLPFLERVTWDAVDLVILIAPQNLEAFLERLPFMWDRTQLLYNTIDVDELSSPPSRSRRYRLGLLGSSPMMKAPHLALDILEGLNAAGPRFSLHIKGRHPWEYEWLWRRPEERTYYEALYERIQSLPEGSVVFADHGNDVAEWLSEIGFILSTSDHEGSHQAVAEGMAAGAIPIVRDWHGATSMYPASFSWHSVDDGVGLIKRLSADASLYEATAQQSQQFSTRFDQRLLLPAYEKAIVGAASVSKARANR